MYDPANGGWQGPVFPPTPGSLQAVGGTQAPPVAAGSYEAFTNIPHPQQLSVFGNGMGNAGFAINNIVTTDIIPPLAPANPPTPPITSILVRKSHRSESIERSTSLAGGRTAGSIIRRGKVLHPWFPAGR